MIKRDYSKISRKDVEYYKCRCKCGNNNFIVTAKELLSGKKSCGCIRKKKGFNTYKIKGDKTIIYFTNRYDEIINKGYIDTEDLQRLIELDYHWSVTLDPGERDYYARYTVYYKDENNINKRKIHCLNRFIMNVTSKDIKVDHINHKTLDNRKKNLRESSVANNTKNRHAKNTNNKSGFRNVFWSNKEERWLVVLQVNKKSKCFGRFKFEDLEKAGALAEKMRQEIYGKFAGKS